MNFTEKIRKDILRIAPKERGLRLAQFTAFLNTSGQVVCGGCGERAEFSFTTADEDVAQYILFLTDELFGICMTVTEADHKHGRNKISFRYAEENAARFIGETERYSAAGLCKTRSSEAEMSAYLQGAFLGSGSCTVPHDGGKTGYHLEFVFHGKDYAQSFLELLDTLQLIGGIVLREDTYVVYCKNRESISDFLAIIGANGALKRLDEISAARAESNRENRVSNCFAGNADKAAIASANHILALQKLQQSGKLARLDEPLRQTAALRMRYPTYSLSELAQASGVSKSCLNHRLRKLLEICKKECDHD